MQATTRRAAPTEDRLPRSPAFRRYLALTRLGRPGVWRAGLALGAALLLEELMIEIGLRWYWSSDGLGERGLSIFWLLLNLAVIGSGWLAFAAAAPILLRRPFWSLLGPDARRFWRGVLVGGGMIAATGAITIAAGTALGWTMRWQSPPEGAVLLFAVAIPLIALQSGAEELMFRGFLAQEIARRLRHPVFWALLPSIVFGILHDDPSAPPAQRWDYVVSSVIFGLAMAYATWRTGSLGFAIGYHVVNNWLALLVIAEEHDYASSLALVLRGPLAGGASTALEAAAAFVIVAALEIRGSPVRRALGLETRAREVQAASRAQIGVEP